MYFELNFKFKGEKGCKLQKSFLTKVDKWSIMPKERFNTCEAWEVSMQGQNKEFMSIKDGKLRLRREVEGKQPWRRRFKANVIKLKYNLELKLSSNTYPEFDIISLGQTTYGFKVQEVRSLIL